MTYEEAVKYIEEIPMFTKKTELKNSRYMLELLGNPQEKPEVIHVAGTNGKGSVCAFLASICRQGGRKTGMFTSPHLVDIRERIQIDGEMVSEESFAKSCETMRTIAEKLIADGYQHPAYFEFLFGMAMEIFAREGVETVVLETGLGGRLDATNAIEHPAVTILTSISMDHMEYLGDTIEAIAEEKAGIIKKGVPVVYWGENPAVADVIEKKAHEKSAQTYAISVKDYEILKIENKKIDFCSFCRYYENSIFTIPFSAAYQVMNASLVLAAMAVLNQGREDKITLPMIQNGFANTVWQGRMEEVLPRIYVDGAHNEDGIRAFAEAVEYAENTNGQERAEGKYLLFSVVKEKDYENMVRLLCEKLDWKGIILTEINGGRRLAGDVMRKLFEQYTDAQIEVCPDIQAAFEVAKTRVGDTDVLYCIGSLYLVGEIKELIGRYRND